MTPYGTWFTVSLLVGTAAYFLVNSRIPYPYMDEEFHYAQTLNFLLPRDEWTWDPKITTPPGLYVIGWVIGQFSKELNCLRLANFFVLFVLGYLGDDAAELVYTFPLFNFYVPLYYTDIWSTFLVLYAYVPKNSQFVPLFLSLWFRQTNIVWAALLGVFNVVQDMKINDLIFNVGNMILRIRKNVPLLGLAGGFAVFVSWNNGIVLGDKSNHLVTLHLAQLLYFWLFFTLFSLPLVRKWQIKNSMFKRLKFAPLELLAIAVVVRYGTVVHPFILSDNRHYTFYLWRRLIQPFNGLMPVPVYWVCWRWFVTCLDFSRVKTYAYLMAVGLVLIPTPLMEPRYYILPYLIWRLYLFKRPLQSLEGLWQTFINVATLGFFCFSKSHFMW